MFTKVFQGFEKKLKPDDVIKICGALFDLLDTDGSESLSLEEVTNARILFKGPGGPSFDERLKAFLEFFDKDGDGSVSRDEVGLVVGKLGDLVFSVAELGLDAATAAVVDDVLKPCLSRAFSAGFPEGIKKEEVVAMLEEPDDAEKRLTKACKDALVPLIKESEEQAELQELLENLQSNPITAPLVIKFDRLRGEKEGVTKEQFKELFVDALKSTFCKEASRDLARELKIDRKSIEDLTGKIIDQGAVIFENIFEIFDQNEDGMATTKELYSVLAPFMKGEDPEKIRKLIIKSVFLVLDTDRSGSIEGDEVIALVVKLVEIGVRGFKVVLNFACSEVVTAEGGEVAKQIDAFFDDLDTDKSGAVDFKELSAPFLKNIRSYQSGNFMGADLKKGGMIYTTMSDAAYVFGTEMEGKDEDKMLEEAGEQGAPPELVFLAKEVKGAKDKIMGKLAMQAMDAAGGVGAVSKTQFIQCVAPVLSDLFCNLVTFGTKTAEEKVLEDGPVPENMAAGAKGATHKFAEALKTNLRSDELIKVTGTLFDLLDTDGSESLRLEEIATARTIFKGPGGPSTKERFEAFLDFFDEDGDGKITKKEMKSVVGKAVGLGKSMIELLADAVVKTVLGEEIKPFVKAGFSKVFPDGLQKVQLMRWGADYSRMKFIEAGLNAFAPEEPAAE